MLLRLKALRASNSQQTRHVENQRKELA